MTPTEASLVAMRVEICRALGWTNIDRYLGREPLPFTREFLGGTDDGLAEGEDTLGHEIKPVPELTLDWMHSAEKTLHKDEILWAKYREELDKFYYVNDTFSPSAIQRATAFLATIKQE